MERSRRKRAKRKRQKRAKRYKEGDVKDPRSRLDALDFLLIAEKIKHHNITGDELAAKFDVARTTVSHRINGADFKGVFQEELEEGVMSAQELLQSSNAEAVRTLKKLMRSGSAPMRRDASKILLEYSIPKKSIVHNTGAAAVLRLPPEMKKAVAAEILKRRKAKEKQTRKNQSKK